MRSITVTSADLSSLRQLLASARRLLARNRGHLLALEEQLKAANVVPEDQIPSDVITINTQARIRELDCGRSTVYTLVFPGDADVARNRISILAPFGSALLGYRAGDLVECAVPGVTRRLRVKEIVYQPETARRLSRAS